MTTAKKQSLFFKSLTGSGQDLREARATALVKHAKNAQDSLVRALEDKVTDLELKLDAMSDFGPKTTYDLTVADGSTMKSWVADSHALSLEISLTREELEIAKSNRTKWFEGDDSDPS
jgi:DNA polymerase III delta subunit